MRFGLKFQNYFGLIYFLFKLIFAIYFKFTINFLKSISTKNRDDYFSQLSISNSISSNYSHAADAINLTFK